MALGSCSDWVWDVDYPLQDVLQPVKQIGYFFLYSLEIKSMPCFLGLVWDADFTLRHMSERKRKAGIFHVVSREQVNAMGPGTCWDFVWDVNYNLRDISQLRMHVGYFSP